jgi:hypothetical protein
MLLLAHESSREKKNSFEYNEYDAIVGFEYTLDMMK